ncbi:MAG: MFS transporter [Anaerolineales bacterium]
MRKNSLFELIKLNTYWFGLSFMWTSLHTLILPALILQYVPDERKNTTLGLLTFTGLIIAAIVQPLSGAASDRWASRFGKRRPAIVFGTLCDMVFLALMAYAGGIPLLALSYVGLQFTSNIAHGPAQGLMHDKVPSEQMGMASGIKNMFDMSGVVVSSLVVGFIFTVETPLAAFIGIALALVLGATFTVFGVHEGSTAAEKNGEPILTRFRNSLRIDRKQHGNYWRLLLVRFLFLSGVYGIQVFAQYFIRDVLQVENPIEFTGSMLAVIVLALMLFSIIAGRIADRIGRKPMHTLAAVTVCVGSILLTIARQPTSVLIIGSVVGAGIGVFLSANWALANDLAPLGEGGNAGAMSRLLGLPIDAVNNLRPGEYLGYNVLFLSAAVMSIVSLLILRKVPEQINPRRTQVVDIRSDR